VDLEGVEDLLLTGQQIEFAAVEGVVYYLEKEGVMPLRDHFHSPLADFASWEELHGLWPGLMAVRLNTLLPPEFRCGVKIHLGALVELDAGTFEHPTHDEVSPQQTNGSGTAWAVAEPALLLETDELTPPEYEVRVYDETDGRRLVAAIELVSPRNKDRADAREGFVSKCHALLQQEVCVVIVDPVTTRSANLYAELANRLGANRPATADASLYAVCCRPRTVGARRRIESWEHTLVVGQALPTLPLWIDETRYVPLELEQTYEDSCRGLRIP
jgi:hypothetical protein